MKLWDWMVDYWSLCLVLQYSFESKLVVHSDLFLNEYGEVTLIISNHENRNYY